jgi:hypothetical protein
MAHVLECLSLVHSPIVPRKAPEVVSTFYNKIEADKNLRGKTLWPGIGEVVRDP